MISLPLSSLVVAKDALFIYQLKLDGKTIAMSVGPANGSLENIL
jgi:hypothetical protein